MTKSKIQSLITGKRITVMGLGVHGGALGNIEWLVRQGAKVLVTDLKRESELGESLEKLKGLENVELVLGEHRMKDFTETDMVLRNPAVPRESKFILAAREAGVPVEMDSSLFFRFWPRERIIGVTGSKGKTTTTTFIGEVLRAGKIKAITIGVEGTAVLPALDKLEEDSWAVFELSSWRLEALAERKVSPGMAVVTSIYRDHLNTYSSFEEYEEIKQAIVKFQKDGDTAILNGDDERLVKWGEKMGKVWWYTMRLPRPPIEMGEAPSVAEAMDGKGNDGSYKNRIYYEKGSVVIERGNVEEVIVARDRVPFESESEARNVLPAILIAKLMGVESDQVERAVGGLAALPHRMEKVAVVNGVTYINDSAATIPEAAISALQSLKGQRIVHILGGSDKELEFEELAEAEREANVKYLVLLPGKATEKIKSVFDKKEALQQIERFEAGSMEEAVDMAAKVAEEGDVVLLSPGATSFGLFKHEFDRGGRFRRAVEDLKFN